MNAFGTFLGNLVTLFIGYAMLEYGVFRLKSRPSGVLGWIITTVLVLLGLGTFITSAVTLVPADLIKIFDATSLIEAIGTGLWDKLKEFGNWVTSL